MLGPSDEKGNVQISKHEILQRAEQELNFAIMDFGNIEAAFSGVIKVYVMNDTQIEAAIDAYNTYKEVFAFPTNYEQDLRQALTIVRGLELSSLRIDAKIIPAGEFRLLVTSQ